MNDAGIDPDHIGKAAVVEHIRSDTTRCGQVIRQTRIGAEQRARNAFDCFLNSESGAQGRN
jgi:hypothetical protein